MEKIDFKECVKRKKIIKYGFGREAVKKEIDSAIYDLERAKEDFKIGDFKWATIKAYYSTFHASRSLLFMKGYKERSHRCLLAFIESYFPDLVVDLTLLMSLREEADYESHYSEESAKEAIELADDFLKKVLKIVRL